MLSAPAHWKFNFVLESECPIMIPQWQGVCEGMPVSNPTAWDVWEGQVWRSSARWWEGRHSPRCRRQAGWPLRWRDALSNLAGVNQHLRHQVSKLTLLSVFSKKLSGRGRLDKCTLVTLRHLLSPLYNVRILSHPISKGVWSIVLSSQRTLALLYEQLANTWSPA